jgi:hypothetical protein
VYFQEVEFIKPGSFSLKELEGLVSALKLAGQKDVKTSSGKASTKGSGQRYKHAPSIEKIVSDLEAMGVRVYGFDETSSVPVDGTVMWENIAGYEHQKRYNITSSVLFFHIKTSRCFVPKVKVFNYYLRFKLSDAA